MVHRHQAFNGNAHEFGTSCSATVAVERWFNHPDYNPDTSKNDIAYLKLAAAIPNECDGVDPLHSFAALDDGVTMPSPQPGDVVAAAGWGTTEFRGEQPAVLHDVQMTLISNTECSSMMGNIFSSSLCAADATERNSVDTCQGDSGGPVSHLSRLAAVPFSCR